MPIRDVTPSGERIIGRLTDTGGLKGVTVRSHTPARQRKATVQRNAWEASPEGQARTADYTALTGDPNKGMYHFMRTYDHPNVGPRHYDEQLPGMADPNAAPRPPRWHELAPEQQAAALKGARLHGTSLDQMSKDLGAQLDQSVLRAASYGSARGSTEDFYSTGEPRQRLDQSAKDLGISPVVHAQMNAFTSPNTKFSQQSSGETVYPNDEAAVHSVRWVQQGNDPEKIDNQLRKTGTGTKRAQGYTTNIKKAAKSFAQHEQGIAPADWVTGKDGSGPFDNSPKTGPYANSWSDSHPQFAVADVHSGGGGALPHLGSAKPVLMNKDGSPKVDKEGKPKRDKSEREKAIASIPHFHSMHDEALRMAMGERNMPSVRGAQALQWGEEQIQRGLVNPDEAYGKISQSRTQRRPEIPGQESLPL